MIGTAVELIRQLTNLVGSDKKYEVKEYKERRSLNANNYAWVLIEQLASKLRIKKEECYLQMLKDYGKSAMVSVYAEVNPEEFFKYYEYKGESTLNGKVFNHYRVIRGSSEYDTKEMAEFIDGIVQECKQQGIETMTPQELTRLKEEWKR